MTADTKTNAGLAVPAGTPFGPNCGVTAVAIVAGVDFKTAWNLCRGGRNRNWKGRTNNADRARALEALGVNWEVGKPRRGMTLQTFVARFTKPGVTYIVRTTGHAQVVRDGYVCDQCGPKHISCHFGRRKIVKEVWRIVP